MQGDGDINALFSGVKGAQTPLEASVVSIALDRKMQILGATLMFDPHFFVFKGIIQTILVAFTMKTYRAYTGMLSSENDDFKFLKTTKNRKYKCITCIIVPRLVELFYVSKTVCR